MGKAIFYSHPTPLKGSPMDILIWAILGALALLIGASLLASALLLSMLLVSVLVVRPLKGLAKVWAALRRCTPPAWAQQNSWHEDLAESLPQDKALTLAAGVVLGYALSRQDKD
jgi:hypothetical protein